MNEFKKLIAATAIAPLLLAGAAMGGNNPVDESWWPSEFGADDQAGGTKQACSSGRSISNRAFAYDG